MRFKLILFFLLLISCNGTEEDLGECYVAPEPDGTCIEIYEPVCACNDLVYSNSCYAHAHYSKNFSKDVKDGDVVLAFLSRSYHESVKNKNAYILTEIGDNNNTNLSDQFLFYSRPKGKYSGNDTKNLLLDFYLVNTEISSTGNKVRATINDSVFLIDEWAPYHIQGLPLGEVKIKLELIDSDGNLIKSQYNPSIRTVTLEK